MKTFFKTILVLTVFIVAALFTATLTDYEYHRVNHPGCTKVHASFSDYLGYHYFGD